MASPISVSPYANLPPMPPMERAMVSINYNTEPHQYARGSTSAPGVVSTNPYYGPVGTIAPVSSDHLPSARLPEISRKRPLIEDQQHDATATAPQRPLQNDIYMESARLLAEMSQHLQTATKDLIASLSRERDQGRKILILTARVNFLERELARVPQELQEE
ncbi:hypothetical protein TWF506_005449 [Arthrobotrys conoides]|uniref:Uncharacterized protein n=1 Tax=Arthrobotrys conoides TaxID=74498 RepID=A0AAN8NJA0_9PEZI